jgi:hypothetical protein
MFGTAIGSDFGGVVGVVVVVVGARSIVVGAAAEDRGEGEASAGGAAFFFQLEELSLRDPVLEYFILSLEPGVAAVLPPPLPL